MILTKSCRITFQKKDTFSSLERRVDTTRVDNDELIDQLIEQHRFDIKEDNSESESLNGINEYEEKILIHENNIINY